MTIHQISLATDAPLATDLVKLWYTTVKSTAPSGMVTTVQVHGDDGALTAVALTLVQEGSRQIYSVPLTRDMTDGEADMIVQAFAAICGEIDFDVYVSTPASAPVADDLEVDVGPLMALCTAWAKREHEHWVNERTASGWRFAPCMSLRDKTHPLLRPWDELPDQNRQIDPARPQEMLDLLSDQGYVMISKGELDAVLQLLRNQSGH